MKEVFHKGQKAVQILAEEQEMAKMHGQMIKDSIVPGAGQFIENQLTAIVGSADEHGNVWISLIVGELGFIKVPNGVEIIFDKHKIKSTENDIFYTNIKSGNAPIGILSMEWITRSRYRVKGLATSTNSEIKVKVQAGYPSCPKHIQRAKISLPENSKLLEAKKTYGTTLGKAEKEWILSDDTFYIATRGLDKKTDASHRGGLPGFIEILEDGALRIPDYFGNSMFSTLGNIYENPNTGLLFVDFKSGKTLQLSGKASLDFNHTSELDLHKSTDTGRFWLFHTEQWIHTENHHMVNMEFVDYSPFHPSIKKNVGS